jgi:hypothetical protein
MSYFQEFGQASDGFAMPPSMPSLMLTPLCEGMGTLNARVAEAFLSLAAVLQSNSARAKEITATSHKATGSEARLQSSHSVGLLQRILADSAATGEMVEVSMQTMLDILSHIAAIHAPLQRLTKMRSFLQTVGVLSRIEGGRISNTSVDLTSLSKDIDLLAVEVDRHVSQMLDDSCALYGLLQDGVGDLRRFQSQEREQASHLIQRTQAVLGPIVARAEALQETAHDIDDQYTNFHRATNSVVMSLQAEDIARQRVEHVQEALRRVAASLDAGESIESCAAVLVLQRSQLVSTRDLIAESVGTIHSGLASLSPRILELVSRTAMLAQQTDEDGKSFAAVIDSGLDTVATVFKQCSSSVKAVLSIVNHMVPSVEQMTNGACALEEIEASIHLISLNATVKTAHLGSEGVAMGVIALELHSITRKSECDTRSVLDGLAAIGEALEKIACEEAISETSLIMGGNGEVVDGELAGLTGSVKTSSQEMNEGLNQVRQLAEALCQELERSCELAIRAKSITELFDEQLRNYDEAFAQLGYTEEMAAMATSSNHAGNLAALYSMESERRLHMEVFGGSEYGASEGSVAASSNLGASEFGDDVELF